MLIPLAMQTRAHPRRLPGNVSERASAIGGISIALRHVNRGGNEMTRASIIGAAAIVMSGVLLGAQAPPSSPSPGRTSGDQAFVSETAMGGMAEVELGKLAADKASNAKVKAFGRQMVAVVVRR